MKPYGHNIVRNSGVAGSQYSPGRAVGPDTLARGVEELNMQHPHKEHDEGLQHKKAPVTRPHRGKAVV